MKCAFHHHDTGPKGKLLGGISFDGGSSAAKERHTVSQAGEQKSQPPFSDINLTGLGNGIDRHGTAGRGTSGNVIKVTNKADVKAAGHKKDTVSINGIQNQNKADTAAETLVIMPPAGKPVLDYKKYMGKIRNGIQAFLKGMEQKAGKENRQQPKKKKMTGTRAVTKEEVYEIRVNTAYLLDSYNKRGERSTLGENE